jgi:hypothetical protein
MGLCGEGEDDGEISKGWGYVDVSVEVGLSNLVEVKAGQRKGCKRLGRKEVTDGVLEFTRKEKKRHDSLVSS